MANSFPADERWTLEMWSADWIVLYDWLSTVDFTKLPVQHKSALQALTDLLNNMDFNLSRVPSVSLEEVERAKYEVSKDMGWGISKCWLQFDGGEVSLRGSAIELRQLASDLQGDQDRHFAITLAEHGHISQVRSSDKKLRVALEGSVLSIQGDAHALEIFYSSLRLVADQAEEPSSTGISAHAHLEYFGNGDEWRTPDSVPLLIQADER